MRRSISLIAVVALAAASCGSGGGDQGFSQVPPDGIALHVYAESGFPSPDELYDQRPLYELDENRLLAFFAVQPEVFPPPILPQLLAVELKNETFDEVLRLIDDSGLPDIEVEINREAEGEVPDASTTVFDYFDGEHHHVLSVLALGDRALDDDPRLVALSDLQRLFDRLAGSSGARPLDVNRLQVIAIEETPAREPYEATAEWNLPADPDDMKPLTDAARCIVFERDKAGAAAEALRNAHVRTLFATPEGSHYRLLARPLLSLEDGCALPARSG